MRTPKTYEGTVYRLGNKTPVKLKDLKPGESIVVVTKSDLRGSTGLSYLHTVYRPPRSRDESPIEYFKRTGCVDDRYFHRHKGLYYCNPAHCRKTWKLKAVRDKHLDQAYAILS